MEIKPLDNNIQFLEGGGEMGKLTREKDWSKTILGLPQFWKQSLRTTLSIILNSKFPMFLFWGEELICFYNDAYRPSLGKEGKHPSILGMKGEDAWTEIWHIIKPLIDQVLAGGEATWSEDQLIPIFRNGKIEDVYWTFSYSPVNDESGKHAGVFVTCTETTDKILTYHQLQESKNQLEFAIDATELGTWDYDPLTNKFSCNKRLKKWFGLSADEHIELHHAVNVMLESDRQRVTEAIQKALDFSSGGNYDIEYTIVHPVTQKRSIVNAKGRAWFNDEKIAYRFNGTLEDITDKATAVKKIKESEERYHNLIYSSPSAIGILYGEDLVITIANEPIIAIWGKGREIMGKKYFEALPELAEQGYKEVFARVYKTGIPFNAVETPVHILQDGVKTLKYYNFVLYPQQNINGEAEGIGIIATEVTSQALLNNQIKESEQRYRELSKSLEEKVQERTTELNKNNSKLEKQNEQLEERNDFISTLLNSSVDIILVVDTEMKCIAANNKAIEYYEKVSPQDILGKRINEVLPNAPTDDVATALKGEKVHVKKFKSTVFESYYELNYIPLYKKNKVYAVMIIFHDITDIINKQEELEKMNKELQSFAYISSHDLQEPLRKIQTFATRIIEKEEDKLSDNAKDQFRRMQGAAKRMQTLIEDLLAYSRTNTQERKFENTDLNKIVEEVKDNFKEDLIQKHATIESTEMCEVNIIPFQFRQLMHNLIGNSLKFSNPGTPPHIKIKSIVAKGKELKNLKLSPQKKYCHISVADNGIGFEPEFSEKIFAVFQRLHGKDEYGGTGIGLSIVKKIVENHNGIITAQSELGKGARFDIFIPAT